MSVRLLFEKNTYLNDVQEIPRAFEPYIKLSEDGEHFLSWTHKIDGQKFNFFVESDLWGKEDFSLICQQTDELLFKRETKYFAKNCLYSFLSRNLQKALPYGSLTGVRPARMYAELAKKTETPREELVNKFHVFEKKSHLIEDCASFQEQYVNRDEKAIGLYVNIPFCPTRCSYCSFISTEIFRVKKQIPLFVECVKKDIQTIFSIIEKKGYSVRSVYVGGGTPTSLEPSLLGEILAPLSSIGTEFTVECGRPDTVNDEVVRVLQKNNVTRLSINPQTFHQKTLDLIGRRHTVEDVFHAYDSVKDKGFDVNFDLIAALPQETFDDFRKSLDTTLELFPENITVHTLSVKRGSDLRKDGTEKTAEGDALRMTDYSYAALRDSGYMPYYMYRQKNTADNLENTGFCRDGRVCLYNVDSMEESCTVLAAGAGAVSKLLGENGKITRFSQPKGFREYCERIDDTERKMSEFFGILLPKF